METILVETSIENDVPLKHQSQAQGFLIANGIHHAHTPSKIADIEMVALQALTYISLKDILPASPPASVLWPAYDRKESWREIPIKDPLLQHAAWAYLRPMSAAHDSDDRSCLARCGGLFGCFGGFVNDVVWAAVKGVFSGKENVVGEDDSGTMD